MTSKGIEPWQTGILHQSSIDPLPVTSNTNSPYNITILEPIGLPDDEIRAGLPGQNLKILDSRGWEDEALMSACQGSEILALTNRPISAALIEALPLLRQIVVAFAGIDHVTKVAAERGIDIVNAIGYANTSVSELVLGLMISLARQIPTHNNAIRRGGIGTLGSEIKGKTLGVVGAGQIGSEVERLGDALGMNVLTYSRRGTITLEELFAQSDFISLHVPLVTSTHKLVGADLLARMKPTAFLINCARGPLVDSAALHNALCNGLLAGAALDVFDREPPLPSDELLLVHPNVIATPHIGFQTNEAIRAKGEQALKHIQAFCNATDS